MKKILFITFILWLSTLAYTHAAWTCLIKDKSAQVLLDYIKNNQIVVKNVTKSVIEERNNLINNRWTLKWEYNKLKDDSLKAKNQTISIFNQMFNFNWFYSYFKYFSVYPISNEIPYQVKRDYRLLQKENKWLVRYIKNIDRNWSSDIIIKNACEWIIWKCDFKEKTAKEIIWKVLKNNESILDLFRLSVIWEPENFNSIKLILVKNNFELEIKKNYWVESINECNSIKWWFFEKITKAITDIKFLNKQWEDWIKQWKEAWQLLIWNRPDEELKIEKKVLRNYLSSENIWMTNQVILNNNLEKYNQDWINENNNFLTNTIKSTLSKTANQLRRWKREIVKDFFNKGNYKNPSYNDLIQVGESSKLTKRIQERITILYEQEVPFAAVWDVTTENLRAKIINTHFSLDNSINILEKTLKLSTKFCNKQDRGSGKCD